jgi:hypothetical protein
MSALHSLIRGLTGNKVTRLSHPGGDGVTSKVTVVDSPPAARRRLVGGDADEGVVLALLTVRNNSLVDINTSEFRLVTPDGEFVIQTNGPTLAGESQTLNKAWVIRDDEYIEFKVLSTATDLAVTPIDILTNFADLRSSEVGRGRVRIPASALSVTKVVVVPQPTPGRVHVPWGKSASGLGPSFYAIKDIAGALAAAVTTYLDDDGTVIPTRAADTVATTVANPTVALSFGVRAMENQSLLASALLDVTHGDAWAFPTYLIVADPKVGEPGSSA